MLKRDPTTHLPLLVCEAERIPRRHRFVTRRAVANLAGAGREHLIYRCESCSATRVWGCEDRAAAQRVVH
jgi:hypothetical protein